MSLKKKFPTLNGCDLTENKITSHITLVTLSQFPSSTQTHSIAIPSRKKKQQQKRTFSTSNFFHSSSFSDKRRKDFLFYSSRVLRDFHSDSCQRVQPFSDDTVLGSQNRLVYCKKVQFKTFFSFLLCKL
jgi:hypothetical protein